MVNNPTTASSTTVLNSVPSISLQSSSSSCPNNSLHAPAATSMIVTDPLVVSCSASSGNNHYHQKHDTKYWNIYVHQWLLDLIHVIYIMGCLYYFIFSGAKGFSLWNMFFLTPITFTHVIWVLTQQNWGLAFLSFLCITSLKLLVLKPYYLSFSVFYILTTFFYLLYHRRSMSVCVAIGVIFMIQLFVLMVTMYFEEVVHSHFIYLLTIPHNLQILVCFISICQHIGRTKHIQVLLLD